MRRSTAIRIAACLAALLVFLAAAMMFGAVSADIVIGAAFLASMFGYMFLVLVFDIGGFGVPGLREKLFGKDENK
jgi:hypothetical protein